MLDPELEMQVDELCNDMSPGEPTEKDMFDIYCWIDSLQFSRAKKNITRDFSDGVLMAELIGHYIPKLVDTRQYYASLSRKNKENNWEHLNSKVLSKLGLRIEKLTLVDIMDCKPGAIEKVLFELRPLLARKNRTVLDYRRSLTKKSATEKSSTHEAEITSPKPVTTTAATRRVPVRPQSRPRTLVAQKKVDEVPNVTQRSTVDKKKGKSPVARASSRPKSRTAKLNNAGPEDAAPDGQNQQIPMIEPETLEVERVIESKIDSDENKPQAGAEEANTSINVPVEEIADTSISQHDSVSTTTTTTTVTTNNVLLAEEYILSGNVSKPQTPTEDPSEDTTPGGFRNFFGLCGGLV